jgi:DNA replication protein DnaC
MTSGHKSHDVFWISRNEVYLYVKRLWNLLESGGNCYVRGAPGTGKSTLAWHWCV